MDALWNVICSPIWCAAWLIVGSLAGSLAHQFVGRGRTGGFAPDVVLGLIGAVVGGILLRFIGFGVNDTNILNPVACIGHLVVATFGASVLIVVGRMISGQSQRNI